MGVPKDTAAAAPSKRKAGDPDGAPLPSSGPSTEGAPGGEALGSTGGVRSPDLSFSGGDLGLFFLDASSYTRVSPEDFRNRWMFLSVVLDFFSSA